MEYNLKLAIISMKRNPVLSALIIGAIGLGTGVFMILLTAYHFLDRNPLPNKFQQVFRVMVDSWAPYGEPGQGIWEDGEPPYMMTYIDAINLMNSDIPTYSSAMFPSTMYLRPLQSDHAIKRPFQVSVRLTRRDFFPMFDTPFLYGHAWDQTADVGPAPFVVLSKEINDRVFGGVNSVGESLELNNTYFKVAGVLDTWRPMPMFYNIMTLGFGVGKPEDVYIPFHFLEVMQPGKTSPDFGWKSSEPGFENWLQSESTWLQFWAQLDTPAQQQAYLDFLDGYAMEQRSIGRFQRPLNNRLYNVQLWVKKVTSPIRGPALAFLVLGLLYLFVCIINLVGMLLGKYLGRIQEISVRRALGAPRAAIFQQHIIEVSCLGVLGGLVGLILSQVVLGAIQVRFSLAPELFALDGYLLMVAIGLATLAGIVAGIIPAWRACNAPPAEYLNAN
jgi:putative ABC transport system permease protein